MSALLSTSSLGYSENMASGSITGGEENKPNGMNTPGMFEMKGGRRRGGRSSRSRKGGRKTRKGGRKSRKGGRKSRRGK